MSPTIPLGQKQFPKKKKKLQWEHRATPAHCLFLLPTPVFLGFLCGFDCVITKPLTVWFTTKCGKFFKRWEYQTTLSASWEICVQVKKQQLEPDMEQQTGSKLGKEYIKAVYCDPAYLTYMQNTSWEMLGWMKYKLESRLLGEISITSVMQMTSPLWQKAKSS